MPALLAVVPIPRFLSVVGQLFRCTWRLFVFRLLDGDGCPIICQISACLAVVCIVRWFGVCCMDRWFGVCSSHRCLADVQVYADGSSVVHSHPRLRMFVRGSFRW